MTRLFFIVGFVAFIFLVAAIVWKLMHFLFNWDGTFFQIPMIKFITENALFWILFFLISIIGIEISDKD